MKKLKILFLAPEVAPYTKTGDMSDYSYSLPSALKDLGHEIRIIMPKYKVINERRYVLREVIRLKNIPIMIGEEEHKINVKSALTDIIKVQAYFVEYKPYFGRLGLYSDVKTDVKYEDNAERFILYAKGCFETLKILGWQPDIIHCHDWQAALVPFILKTYFKNDEFFKDIATMLSVHDFEEQGKFSEESIDLLGYEDKHLKKCDLLVHDSKFNFLRAGFGFSDHVNVLNEKYAKLLKKGDISSNGFEPLINGLKRKFSGITNGIDYNLWDPEKDKKIEEKYTSVNLEGKEECKEVIVDKFSFDKDSELPLAGYISDLNEANGGNLLIDSLEKILVKGVSVIVAGNANEDQQKKLNDLQAKYAGKLGLDFEPGVDELHQYYAAMNIVLSPLKSNMCNTDYCRGMRYGAVPLVRSIGAASEYVEQFEEKSGKGNGFVFDEFTVDSFMKALDDAVEMYSSKYWRKITKAAMRTETSWKTAAKNYSKIYEDILKK